MSVSSVALSSLATSPPAVTPVATEGAHANLNVEDRPVRPTPVPSPNEQQPVKAALPLKVGQTIDISA